MMTRSTVARAGAAFFAVPAALVMVSGPAAAADGDVLVSNTETVQAYLNASGKLDVARVYEQVALQGRGSVTLSNPVETKGLRNLDGFGGFDVRGGNVVGRYQVDGEKRLRTVSDFAKPLPLEVDVRYTLDGREVKPGDVVGKRGRLKVQYTVRNVTGKVTEVEFDDGTGKQTKATEDVVIPMVGSLSTVLPSNFTDVRSAEANMAGDGRGGTKMSFTMTLFGPIGRPEATFGYEAQITDGVVPKASISALPVSPLDSPSFKGGAESYKGGAETGATLTAGANEIDANLLKLRDGAADLLAGLIQLRDGANQLNAGLAGEAAPGARKLSDGATQLKDGTGKLAAGAGDAKSGSSKLADGANQLADGLNEAGAKAPALVDGLVQVAIGLERVDAGLVDLHGGIGTLPAEAKPLHDGITKLKAGLGGPDKAGTLIYGVKAVRSGIEGTAIPGINDLIAGLYNNPSAGNPDPGAYQKLSCAQAILTDVVDGTLANGRVGKSNPCYVSTSNPAGATPPLAGLKDGATDYSKTVTTGVRDQIKGSLTDIVADPANPTLPNDSTLVGGLEKLKVGLDDHEPLTYGDNDAGGALYALAAVECGLSNTTIKGVCDPKKPGLLEGLGAVDAGVSTLVNGVVTSVQGGVGDDDDLPEDETLRGGVHGLMGGIDLIGEGGVTLLDGLGRLSEGADQVAGGAGKLDEGLGELAEGAGKLDDGAAQLSDGAGQLSDGLGDAADGSGKIADGLEEAAGGAPKLEAGAQRLSDEGTKKLVEAGKATAADYGQKYALIEAGAQRAKTEGMAYGAPADAAGTTAYSFELAGMSGEGSRNLGRSAGAVAIFGLAGAAAFLRRRFV